MLFAILNYVDRFYGGYFMIYGSVLKVTRQDTIEDIKNTFLKMKECGHNTVVIWPAAFWWEEKSDIYPFATGVEILKVAKECGINIIMELAGQLTSMEYMPDFKFKSEYYATDFNGHTEFGQPSFGFLNYFHPEVNTIICNHFKAVANAYKDCDALIGYDVFNETMYRSFDKYTIAQYRMWLKDKYKTIENLNSVWERTYSDFEQINYEPWMWMSVMPEVDYCIFRKKSISLFLKNWCDAIREVDTKHPLIADNIHSMTTVAGSYTRPQDDFALADVVDSIGMSFYPKGVGGCMEPNLRWQIFNSYYAASKRKGFMISEMQTHIQAMYNPTTAVRPYELKQWCMEAVSAGATSVIYWMWRPFDKGLQTGGRGLVDYKGRETERFYTAKDIFKSIENLDNISPVTPKVGIVYDDLCEDFQRAYTKAYDVDQNIYLNSVAGAYKVMMDSNIPCDIIKLDEINNYKVVLLAGHIVLDKNDAQKLKDYANNGGIVIADYRLGQIDKTSMMHKNLPGGYFNDFMGIDYKDTDCENLDFEFNQNKVEGYYSKAICDISDAKVIATFKNGDCAIAQKGNVYTINTDIWYGYSKTNSASITTFAKDFLQKFDIWDIKTNSEVKLKLCENKSKYFVFAFNYTSQNQQVNAKIFDKEITFEVDANDVKIYEVQK